MCICYVLLCVHICLVLYIGCRCMYCVVMYTGCGGMYCVVLYTKCRCMCGISGVGACIPWCCMWGVVVCMWCTLCVCAHGWGEGIGCCRVWKLIRCAYGIRKKVEAKDRLKDKYKYFISVLLCMWSMVMVYDGYIWFMILIYEGCVLG